MRSRLDDDGREPTGTRSDMMEVLDLLGRRIGGAIVVAGALIGFGIYWSSSEEPQTYQGFATDGEVFRLNTDSGTLIACNASRCIRVLERGQELAEGQGNTLFKAPPAAQPGQAVQLPAPAPGHPAVPAPAQPKQAPTAQPE